MPNNVKILDAYSHEKLDINEIVGTSQRFIAQLKTLQVPPFSSESNLRCCESQGVTVLDIPADNIDHYHYVLMSRGTLAISFQLHERKSRLQHLISRQAANYSPKSRCRNTNIVRPEQLNALIHRTLAVTVNSCKEIYSAVHSLMLVNREKNAIYRLINMFNASLYEQCCIPYIAENYEGAFTCDQITTLTSCRTLVIMLGKLYHLHYFHTTQGGYAGNKKRKAEEIVQCKETIKKSLRSMIDAVLHLLKCQFEKSSFDRDTTFEHLKLNSCTDETTSMECDKLNVASTFKLPDAEIWNSIGHYPRCYVPNLHSESYEYIADSLICTTDYGGAHNTVKRRCVWIGGKGEHLNCDVFTEKTPSADNQERIQGGVVQNLVNPHCAVPIFVEDLSCKFYPVPTPSDNQERIQGVVAKNFDNPRTDDAFLEDVCTYLLSPVPTPSDNQASNQGSAYYQDFSNFSDYFDTTTTDDEEGLVAIFNSLDMVEKGSAKDMRWNTNTDDTNHMNLDEPTEVDDTTVSQRSHDLLSSTDTSFDDSFSFDVSSHDQTSSESSEAVPAFLEDSMSNSNNLMIKQTSSGYSSSLFQYIQLIDDTYKLLLLILNGSHDSNNILTILVQTWCNITFMDSAAKSLCNKIVEQQIQKIHDKFKIIEKVGEEFRVSEINQFESPSYNSVYICLVTVSEVFQYLYNFYCLGQTSV